MRTTRSDSLILYHHGWGTGIRNELRHRKGGGYVIQAACGYEPRHLDDASGVIIEAVWKRLQDANRFAVQDPELITVKRRLVVKDPLPLITAEWGDAVVFPVEFGNRFMHQCSRSTLGNGDSYWVPVPSDIEKAEAAFRGYKPAAELLKAWPDLRKYHRQYIGVVRGNRKTLYASFQPAGETLSHTQPSKSMCTTRDASGSISTHAETKRLSLTPRQAQQSSFRSATD